MGHIKEPEGVDFMIESKPLTDKDRKVISDFIKRDKAQNVRTPNKKRVSQRHRKPAA